MKFVSQLLLLTHCPVDARQISSSPEESGSVALKRALFSPRSLGRRKKLIKKVANRKSCFEQGKSYTGSNSGEKKDISSAEKCQEACEKCHKDRFNPSDNCGIGAFGCSKWTYKKKESLCVFKKQADLQTFFGGEEKDSNAISGVRESRNCENDWNWLFGNSSATGSTLFVAALVLFAF